MAVLGMMLDVCQVGGDVGRARATFGARLMFLPALGTLASVLGISVCLRKYVSVLGTQASVIRWAATSDEHVRRSALAALLIDVLKAQTSDFQDRRLRS